MKKFLSSLLICLFAVSLIGCGPKPEASLKAFFDATKNCDFEQMSNYIETTNEKSLTAGKFENTEQEQVIKGILKNVDYEILSTTVDKNAATSKVKVTSIDMLKVYSETLQQLMAVMLPQALSDKKPSDEEMEKTTMQYLLNGINNPNVVKTTTEVEIKMNKVKDKWIITPSDALSDALTGNLSKANPQK